MRLENLSSAEAEAIIQKKRKLKGKTVVFFCCVLVNSSSDAVKVFGLYCVMNILMSVNNFYTNSLLGEEELQTTPFSDVPPQLKMAKLILLFHGYPATNNLLALPVLGAQYCFLGAVIGFLGLVIDVSLTGQTSRCAEGFWVTGVIAVFFMLAKFVLKKECVEKGLKNLNAEDQHLARACLQKEASLRACSAAFFSALVSISTQEADPAYFFASVSTRFL